MNDNKNEELPMNWWEIWKYLLFPLGILSSIGTLYTYTKFNFSMLNTLGWTVVIVHTILTIFLCIIYGMFLSKNKKFFNFFAVYLFIYPAWNVFINCLNNNSTYNLRYDTTGIIIMGFISYSIICAIWCYPNCEYFRKRSHCFDKEVKNIENKAIVKKQTVKNDSEVKTTKYCTKCGKKIDSKWKFCNYCGKKIN